MLYEVELSNSLPVTWVEYLGCSISIVLVHSHLMGVRNLLLMTGWAGIDSLSTMGYPGLNTQNLRCLAGLFIFIVI